MSNCSRCGAKLGFLESGPMCGSCNTFLPGALRAFDQRLEWTIGDRYITPEKEADLRAYQHQLRLTDWDVASLIPKLHRAKALTAINLGDLPSVAPGNIMLPRNEVCHFITQAALYQEQVSRAYVSSTRNRSSGTAWHGRHVGVRGGSSNRTHVGQWVQTSEVVCVAQGPFVVTNGNVRFIGQPMLTIPLTEIIGFNWYVNAIELQYEGRDARDFFAVSDGEWAASVIMAARRRLDGPEEPYR